MLAVPSSPGCAMCLPSVSSFDLFNLLRGLRYFKTPFYRRGPECQRRGMTCRGVLMGEGQAARLQPGTGPCAYGLFVYL